MYHYQKKIAEEVSKYTLKPTELKEAQAKDIVKGITDMDGPFTVVAIKNNKVIKQEGTKMRDALPAIVKMMRKEVGSGVTISIEGKKGILNTFKEEVEVTEQLANYRAFHARTGQQITVQASSTREAEAKAVEALKAANKKSVYVRYLGPVKEEVEVTEQFEEVAKHNLDISTRKAEKKDREHNSQWGFGFRAYCRAVLRGDAGKSAVPTDAETKRGWVDARKMVAGGERIKEEVEVTEVATPAQQQKKNSYAEREAQAKEIAKKILQVAKERGVRVYTDGSRVVSATKDFPKGDVAAFNKAYNDCGMVLTHMRFTKNGNQWGCSSAGFGVGAQECVKAGRAQQHKSGDGGSLIIKFLKV